MKYEFVDYEQEGPVVIVRMNRPELRNSMSKEMTRDLGAALDKIENDESIRIAILTGVGNSFSAGDDVKDKVEGFKLTQEEQDKLVKDRKKQKSTDIVQRLSHSMVSKPMIAAVNGYAVGGGFKIAMGCDLVVAAESAIFQMVQAFRGSVGAAGWVSSPQMFPDHVGLEICLGAKLTAQRAYETGLINKVVPDNQLIPAAMEMAKGISMLAPLAVKSIVDAARRMTYSRLYPSIVEMLEREVEIIGKTEDHHEGFRAFKEKRKPVWKGR